MINASLSDYLQYVPSQKEVQLIIANQHHEIAAIKDELYTNGFSESFSYSDLLKQSTIGEKTFLILDSTLPKEIYDFVVQYPTGRIQIFDKTQGISRVVAPKYDDSACVLVLSEQTLRTVQESGFDLLSHVGLTYRKENN